MPPIDKFASAADDRGDPARDVFVIVPGAVDLAVATKAIRAGADGTITLQAINSGAEIVHPVLNGERIDLVLRRVTACNPANMVIIGYA